MGASSYDRDDVRIKGVTNPAAPDDGEYISVIDDAGVKRLAVDGNFTPNSDTKIKGDTDDTLIGNNGDHLLTQGTVEGATDGTLIGNVSDSLKTNVTASALPTGAATEAKQDVGNTSLSAIDTQMTDGSQISKIKGDTDGTLIGNVNDRLKVEADFSPGAGIPIIPADNLTYKAVPLENAGSKDMAVDGSVTTQYFTHSVAAGEVVYISGITFLIHDAGNNSLTTFGTLPALTNGVKVEMSIGGTNREVANIKDNADIILKFTGAFGTQGNGGFAPDDAFWGKMDLDRSVTLTGDDGDFIRIAIQDDLSSIATLQAAILFWQVVT